MNSSTSSLRIAKSLFAATSLALAVVAWLPAPPSQVVSAAAYTGTFDFDESDPSIVIGCTADACNGMAITIPSSNSGTPVTSIASGAFAELQLTGVTIPNTITSIGSWAFGANHLTTARIPNSVLTVGDGAFNGNDLETLTIGNSVTSIGARAFELNELATVSIPNSVTTIGSQAFMSNQLTTLTLGSSLTGIPSVAFARNFLTSVTIPNSVTTIGDNAFDNNRITAATIPNSVTSIGSRAFAANSLTSITIPNSVTTIGEGAFTDNELTSVTIPRSVDTLGVGVFSDNMLTSIKFLGNRPTIARWGSKIWSLKCVYYTAGKSGWPGNTINGITPTLQEDCDDTNDSQGGYFSFPYLTPRQVAYNAGLHLVAASKVRISVLEASSAICRVVEGTVRGTRSGMCRISVTVTAPDGTIERGLLVANFRK